MCSTSFSYKRPKLLTISEHLGSLLFYPFFVSHLFSFVCGFVLLFFVLFVFILGLVCLMLPVSLDCLRPGSCLSNVTSVSGLPYLIAPSVYCKLAI